MHGRQMWIRGGGGGGTNLGASVRGSNLETTEGL